MEDMKSKQYDDNYNQKTIIHFDSDFYNVFSQQIILADVSVFYYKAL